MRIDIIPIGNSRGIRIPSSVLKQCGLLEHAELRVENGKIILDDLERALAGVRHSSKWRRRVMTSCSCLSIR